MLDNNQQQQQQKQQRANVPKADLSKLKTFCDYLFYDQTKHYASYPRFIESCGFILEHLTDIDPLTLFKDICGLNCKYITPFRLIKRYKEMKDNRRSVHAYTYSFFSFLFNTCIKNTNDNKSIGRELANMTYSTDFNTDRRITNLCLYKDAEETLKGITIEYNNNYKSDLYNEYSISNWNDMFICLNMPLEYLKEIKAYDGITHCFGSYTEKIEYIGFKCRSGVIKSFGIQKGEPFLFGQYGKEVNGFKIQITNQGITYLQPSFNDCGVTNSFIDVIDKKNAEDIKIYEEKLFNEETNAIDASFILYPLVKDYNEDNLKYDFFYAKTKTNLGTLDSKLNDFFIKERAVKGNKNSKDVNKDNIIQRWKRQTIKFESINSFLLNTENYNTMLNKMRFEIEREIEEEILKYDYDKNFDFYDEYLMKYNILDPFPFNPKHYDNYVDIKSIEIGFSTYNKEKQDEEENQRSNNTLFELRSPSNLYTNAKISSNWRSLYKKMTQRSTLSLFKSVMCLLKSIKIIQTIEDKFTDDTIPLEDKITYYKELINCNRIIHYLSSLKDNNGYYSTNPLSKQRIHLPNEEEKEQYTIDDYPAISYKLLQIESLIKTVTNKEQINQLAFLYRKYYKIKLDLINQINKEKLATSLKAIEEKYDCKDIKEEISKEKTNVNRSESILFTSGDIEISSLKPIELINVPIYKKQSLIEGKEFKDSLFPSSPITLFSDIKWEKIDMILYSTQQEVYSLNKIDSNIQCGLLVSNYFHIALMSLIKFPFLIKRLFPFWQKSENGQYGVYMRIKGIWKLVLLDNYFPCLLDKQNISSFAFSSLNKSHQIWVQLIEKAYAKINQSYNNIINGTVKDVLDVVTNSLTEKFNVSMNMKPAILDLIRKEIKTAMLIAKAIGSSMCIDVGLIPNQYYCIEEIKDINIGGLPEVLIKLSNPFGCLKYKGDWSKNSNKWIPSLRTEKPVNDNEFYVSINDFIKYFSVIYINRVYHLSENEEKLNYAYVHFSKKDTMTPKVTKLVLASQTQLDIQFHQRNPKHKMNNDTNTVVPSSPGFVLITDSRYKYINSIAQRSHSFNLHLTLPSGDYYIYSDIFTRYLTKENQGYTISVYSQSIIELIKDNVIQPQDVLNQSIIAFIKESIIPIQEEFNLNVYQLNKISAQFPFALQLYSNEGPFDNSIEVNINKTHDIVKNYALYSSEEHLTQATMSQLAFNLNPSKEVLLMLLRLNHENTFNINFSIEVNATQRDKEEYIKQQGEKENLDEEGIVIQYVLRCKDGCYVLIKNNAESEDFKMKLVLKGLKSDDHPKGDIVFVLLKQSSQLFRLREVEINNSGINSFMFQLA